MFKYATMNFYSGSTRDSFLKMKIFFRKILLYKCWNVLEPTCGAKYKKEVPTVSWWPSLALGGEVVWV